MVLIKGQRPSKTIARQIQKYKSALEEGVVGAIQSVFF
jgi:hypothetical protein